MSSETAAEAAVRAERPAAPMQTESFRLTRPEIVGPDSPESPFPIALAGCVQRGFGRGGKDLGCPTANFPDESLPPLSSVAMTGVFFGFAQVVAPGDGEEFAQNREVLPMVMSLGWNPFYNNEKLTAEVHIMHDFISDFYGYEMRALVLGYIRPELNYTSREALIEDIQTDKQVALRSLARTEYQKYVADAHFISL